MIFQGASFIYAKFPQARHPGTLFKKKAHRSPQVGVECHAHDKPCNGDRKSETLQWGRAHLSTECGNDPGTNGGRRRFNGAVLTNRDWKSAAVGKFSMQ